MESVDKDMVVTWIKNGCTIQWISEELQKQYPDRRGLSARSVRRFCQKENITKMTENETDETCEVSIKCTLYISFGGPGRPYHVNIPIS